jgi:hypothetical protein
MKKIAALAVAATVLALAAVAYGQVVNTYTVDGSTSPTNAGTSKKPVPVSVKFGYTIGEQGGQRPSPVKTYSIAFAGLRVNTSQFPKCSAATLDSKGPKGCPSGSLMGTGFITNATGAKDNPSDKSIQCNAALSVYNSGSNKGVIYVAGSPQSTDNRTKCAIELAAPIPARFIRASNGQSTSLQFTVPPSLLHPLPTLDNAVTSVTSTIKRVTKTVSGRKVGFFESVGGCKSGKRAITVTFTPESGPTAKAQKLATCRK